MQQPIERRHGAPKPSSCTQYSLCSCISLKAGRWLAWLRSCLVRVCFIVWSSGSLIPGTIGHIVMDIGLFAFWWTGIAREFTARLISVTGVDQPFLVTCATWRPRSLLCCLRCGGSGG